MAIKAPLARLCTSADSKIVRDTVGTVSKTVADGTEDLRADDEGQE